MSARIAIAGLHMECATFLPHVTTRDVFETGTVRGPALLETYRGSNTVPGGFIAVLEETGAAIAPLIYVDGRAAGLADHGAVAGYRAELVDGLKALEGQIDGVLLHLHGAMVTQEDLDPDAETLHAVRAAAGPDMPIMLALDYHANLDQQSIDGATAVFGYRYSPHIDMGATGERAATCLLKTLSGDIRPQVAIARPGLLVPSIFSATDLQPLKQLVARTEAYSEGNDIYRDVSLFAGFAYADVPNCGASVVAVVDGSSQDAQRLADDLSADIDAHRAALSAPLRVYQLEAGIERAFALAKTATRPIVILEHADRANDSTYGLRALLEKAGEARIAVPFLWDPDSAAKALVAGPGAQVTMTLGGHSAPHAGGPISVTATVEQVRPDFTYRGTGTMRAGSEVRLGDTALLDVAGIKISVTSLTQSAIDFDPFYQFGLDPADFDVVLLRSKTHFRAAWEPFAAEIIVVDTPDYGPADLSALEYKHAPYPVL
ncbi:MAG: M81 family metallopeptidase [Pseudomonadota bacterium]